MARHAEEDFCVAKWLESDVVKACAPHSLTLRSICSRGYGGDFDVRAAVQLANPLCRFRAIQLTQIQIHPDKVGPPLLEGLDPDIVERSMSSIAAIAVTLPLVCCRVAVRDEQSLKLLECRADRGEPDRTRLRWRGTDAIRKGLRITARGGDFDIGRFRPRGNHITDIAACLATLRGFGWSMHLIFRRDKHKCRARRAVPRLLQW